MANNSDYNKEHTNLLNLLPEVYQSDAAKSIFGNLFDRFMTKQEVKKVTGYVGKGNPNAIISRRIQEPTLERQVNQLQPLIRTKIGSIEHLSSWNDIVTELKLLGIDIDNMSEWGSVQSFNWVPPIDIDKLVNYQDYYWVDEQNPNARPQYITIRSRCATATSQSNFWSDLVERYGSSMTIKSLVPVHETPTLYNIKSVNATSGLVELHGPALGTGTYVRFYNTSENAGVHKITTAPQYHDLTNTTTITLDPSTLTVNLTDVGTLGFELYDGVVIDDDFTRLFEPGFVLFVAGSSNSEVGDTFVEVTESVFDSESQQTIVRFNAQFSDSVLPSAVSIQELYDIHLSNRNCLCGGDIGWDMTPFDDNPLEPLWSSTTSPTSHQTLLEAITFSAPPTNTDDIPTSGVNLWYSVSNDVLYQHKSVDELGQHEWKVIWNNFSVLLNDTKGLTLWDYTLGCSSDATISSADQWIDQNKWMHKADVVNFSIAKQAQLPIIEFEWDIELNEWNETQVSWKYRNDFVASWSDTEQSPDLIELTPLSMWEYDAVEKYIVFDESYGDMTSFMVDGFKMQSNDLSVIFEVAESVYRRTSSTAPYQTHMRLKTGSETLIQYIVNNGLVPGNLALGGASSTPFKPNKTSLGAAWRGYNQHWLYKEHNVPVPCNHQPANPFEYIAPTAQYSTVASGEYDEAHTYFKQTIRVNEPISYVALSDDIIVGSTRPLTRRALVGSDDVRVYINERRSYGTYDQVGESVMVITGFSAIASGNTVNSWFVKTPDAALHVSPGDEIRVAYNTTSANGTYTVQSVIGNQIIVNEHIPSSALLGGELSNVTSTMSNVAYGIDYVVGIQFTTLTLTQFDVVDVIVGPATMEDFGKTFAPVRVVENDEEFRQTGAHVISLTEYHVSEQVKTEVNQYPLFDLYDVNNAPLNDASAIFGFAESDDRPANLAVSRRIVQDGKEFAFDQFLIEEDGGNIKAYRNYSNTPSSHWYNPNDEVVYIWDGLTWRDKTDMNGVYATIPVSDHPPTQYWTGSLWFDKVNLQMYGWNGVEWQPSVEVCVSTSDVTLQTIWREGTDLTRFTPELVDWNHRTIEQYEEEKAQFVSERIDAAIASHETIEEAYDVVELEWYESQINHLSPTGQWIGEWKYPDPLFYNNQHENRKIVYSSQLYTHFSSIIEKQPRIPGYDGRESSMFRLLSINDVNYGIGGTIKEFNDSYDVFLSSIYVDTVTPLSLIEFAQNQYESLLTKIVEKFKSTIQTNLTNTSQNAILNTTSVTIDNIITAHEQDTRLSGVYGDSSTFIDNDGVDDLGIRNWIVTLPYLRASDVYTPFIRDTDEGYEVVHHDGHVNSYDLTKAATDIIIRALVDSIDPRSGTKIGTISTNLPPASLADAEAVFGSLAGRSGIFWYYINPSDTADRTLYRLTAAAISNNEPSAALPDGTLWVDNTLLSETLRVKTTTNTGLTVWEQAPGASIGTGILYSGPFDDSDVNVWTEIDLSKMLAELIVSIETKLIEPLPEQYSIAYDVSNTRKLDEVSFDRAQESAFYDYVLQSEIETPLTNIQYSATDPFTWNYVYSSEGVKQTILTTEPDSFFISGDQTGLFDVNGLTFYVKNSTSNNGTWTTTSIVTGNAAEYDASADRTRIYVTGTVDVSQGGIIYLATLPSSRNTGSESAAYWKALYEQLYGTPYPHLEPWKLQNFSDKPEWWDDEYANDDTSKWGDRRWKYKHGFDVVEIIATGNIIKIDGDFTEVFNVDRNIQIDSTVNHAGEYVVESSTYDVVTNTTSIVVSTDIILNGTEGRVLLGKFPTHSSTVSPVASAYYGGYGMWENIRVGHVPAGRHMPTRGRLQPNYVGECASIELASIQVPTYSYFSVNITNGDVNGGYGPDEVLPPMWNHSDEFGNIIEAVDATVRSLYSNYFVDIISPSSNYRFGDIGPVEYSWRQSTQFKYDQLKTSFKLDPVRAISGLFGYNFTAIGGLQIDLDQKKPVSHTRTIFHGDVVGTSEVKVNGLNQWYVNYNRFNSIDTSFSNFRTLWTKWDAPLSYLYGSYIDVPSMQIGHRHIALTSADTTVTSKWSRGVEEFFLDAFTVSVTNVPPAIISRDNSDLWTFELRTNSRVGRDIEYYGVKKYNFDNIDSNTFRFNVHQIKSADIATESFVIPGEFTDVFTSGSQLVVEGSQANDGLYDIVSAVFDQAANETKIFVDADVISSDGEGILYSTKQEMTWDTGTRVYLTTTNSLPYPLEVESYNELTPYFIINNQDGTFSLAESAAKAHAGTSIEVSSGLGDHFIGQLRATFTALDGQTTTKVWKHYEIDRNQPLVFNAPFRIRGIQQLIDVIDGYSEMAEENGWVINDTKEYVDPATGRLLDWQLELERFIDFCYKLRLTRTNIPDSFLVTPEEGTDSWTLDQPNTYYETGDRVLINSTNNVLPQPFVKGIRYYFVRTSPDTFALADSLINAKSGVTIGIADVTGIGDIALSKAVATSANYPKQEINPFRNAIWFRPPRGIVSNIVKGPSEDIQTARSLIDQYGRPLDHVHVHIFRQDKQTQITVDEGINNDVIVGSLFDANPYNELHVGGVHLFVDTTEHVLIFESYTSSGQLIYDPYVGLNATKFEMLFNRQVEFTERPNVGGYYLHTNEDQTKTLRRNVEASVEDLRYLNDTYNVIETNQLTKQGRKLLGYNGTKPWFDKMNMSSKSQFAFWRGQIHHKGSQVAVDAFVNSRRFLGAKVDDFWAFKVGEFGDAGTKDWVEMYLKAADVRSNEFRMQFVSKEDFCDPGFGAERFDTQNCGYAFPDSGEPIVRLDTGYVAIAGNDDSRWRNHPGQLAGVSPNESMYLDTIVVDSVKFDIGSSAQQSAVGWIDPTNQKSYVHKELSLVVIGVDYDANAFVVDRAVSKKWEVGTTITVTENASIAGEYEVNEVHDNKVYVQSTIPSTVEIYAVGTLTRWEVVGQWTPTTLPIVKHDLESEYVGVQVSMYQEHETYTYTLTAPTTVLGGIPQYIPYTGMLNVFIDGIKAEPVVDYVEVINAIGPLTATEIILINEQPAGTVIDIALGKATLLNRTHYEEVNSNVVRFMSQDIVSNALSIEMFGYQLDYHSQNPSKVIDTKSQTVVANVPFWDPARGQHYHNANHLIDVWNSEDPASYNVTNENTQYPTPVSGRNLVYLQTWSKKEVGTVWADTSLLYYVPYFDVKSFPSIDERLSLWGRTADFAEFKVYEWVESDVHPSEWNAIAAEEEGNDDIAEEIRKSGTVKTTLFSRTRPTYVGGSVPRETHRQTVTLDTSDGKISNNTPTGLYGSDVISVRVPLDSAATQQTFSVSPYPWSVPGLVSATLNGEPVVVSQSSATTVTVSTPSGVTENDIIIITIASPTYYASVSITTPSGILTQVISVKGSRAPTYGELLSEIEDDLTSINVSLQNSVIVFETDPENEITSAIADSTDVNKLPLFASLDQFVSVNAVEDGVNVSRIDITDQLEAGSFVSGDRVLVVGNSLPSPLEVGVKYQVGQYNFAESYITLLDDAGNEVDITESSAVTVVPADFTSVWKEERTLIEEFDVAVDGTEVNEGSYSFNLIDIEDGQTIDVYVNGLQTKASLVVNGPVIVSNIKEADHITIVRPGARPSDDELAFDPIEEDQGQYLTQYDLVTEYVEKTKVNSVGVEVPVYYFWVERKNTRSIGQLISPADAEQDIITIPGPYIFPQRIKEYAVEESDSGDKFTLPIRFGEAVVRGLRGIVDDDNRFVLRYTKDFTLRDSLVHGKTPLDLKNVHTEWVMRREKQLSHIDRWLWNRVTEAMVGFKLNDPSIRVPSYDRELYDAKYGTSTQYGLESGQIFVDPTLAKSTILGDLTNPNNSFFPFDINVFFERNSFDTAENIIKAMDTLYNTLHRTHVNRIFFEVLRDAITTQKEHSGVMKTSMISLHGVRPFQVNGVFDD